VLAYWNSFDGVFLYDDLPSIRDNPHIHAAFSALHGNSGQREHAGQGGCGLEIAPPKGVTDVIDLVGIVQREIWGPAGIRVDQLNIDLSHIVSLMHQFRVMSGCHFLLLKSSVHFAGSGRP